MNGWFTRATAHLTVMAVLGLLFMPVAGAMTESGGWTALEICSANGPQPILIDEKGKTVPTGKATHQHVCPFCSAHAGYSLPPPVSPGATLPMVASESPPLRAAAVVAPEPHFLIGHSPRDPPFA